jgi:prepilin-type N-terminal cleavage/methylation domain-containing protein
MPLRRRIRPSDERGFTLVEMLVAMSIGVVILLGAFMLLDRSFTSSAQIADRQEGLQRGRQAMEVITRQLRSQVCIGTSSYPVVSGTDTSVTFYGSLSESSTNVTKRTLTFSSTGAGSITETAVTGTGTYPALTFPTPVATDTKTVLTNVKQVMDGATARPIFKYYRYKPGAPVGDLELLGTPLATANLGSVALIKVAFRAYAVRPIADDNDAAQLEDDVYIRISDSSELQETPQCV